MRVSRNSRKWIGWIGGAGMLGAASWGAAAPPPPRFRPPPPSPARAPVRTVSRVTQRTQDAPPAGAQRFNLGAQEGVTTIDLASALDLAGVRNPEIMLARERVTE